MGIKVHKEDVAEESVHRTASAGTVGVRRENQSTVEVRGCCAPTAGTARPETSLGTQNTDIKTACQSCEGETDYGQTALGQMKGLFTGRGRGEWECSMIPGG